MKMTTVQCVVYIKYVHAPATYLLRTFYVPATYVLRTCYVPATYPLPNKQSGAPCQRLGRSATTFCLCLFLCLFLCLCMIHLPMPSAPIGAVAPARTTPSSHHSPTSCPNLASPDQHPLCLCSFCECATRENQRNGATCAVHKLQYHNIFVLLYLYTGESVTALCHNGHTCLVYILYSVVFYSILSLSSLSRKDCMIIRPERQRICHFYLAYSKRRPRGWRLPSQP